METSREGLKIRALKYAKQNTVTMETLEIAAVGSFYLIIRYSILITFQCYNSDMFFSINN